MSVDFEQITELGELTEGQRIRARERAKMNMMQRAGGEPQYEDFERQEHSKYSPGVERFMQRAIWLLFLAAFVLSATHIFMVAFREYGKVEGIPPILAAIAGVCFVLTADIAAILFLSAPGVYGHVMSRSVIMLAYVGAFMAAFVSMIFNVAMSIKFGGSAFDWLIKWVESFATDPKAFWVATLPPTFVLIVGYIQKSRILAQNERLNRASVEYGVAVDIWRAWAKDIEHDPKWSQAWATALWEEWRKTNMVNAATLTPEQKRLIVLREMNAENWWNSDGIPLGTSGNARKRSGNGLVDSMESQYDVWTQAERAAYWMEVKPELLDMSISEATELLGVGNSTYYKAKGMVSKNGHTKTD